MTLTTTTDTNPRRYNLDEIEARLKADHQAEQARMAPISRPAPPEVSEELARMKAENERMRAMILNALDARNRAREFMTIWNDPRKLPELIQEIYVSDTDIAKLKKAMGNEYPVEIVEATAQRAARLKAHIALTYELHPMVPGMIYVWFDKGAVATEVGWRGYQELINRRENLDIDGPRPMTEEERALHGLGPDDKGAICILYDWKKVERFRAHGKPDPAPTQGIGAWRAKGRNGSPDNIAQGRTSQWVAEKDAFKDLARKVLDYPVNDLADANIIEVVYDGESGLWRLPVPIAAWLSDQRAVARFENLLKEHGLSDDEFNAFLGHNWRYTQLDPQALKAQFDTFIAQQTAIEGTAVVVEVPEKSEAPAKEPESAEDVTPSVADLPFEPTRPALEAAVEPKKCTKCHERPAVETPMGSDYCALCARKLADEQAKES